MVPSQNAIDLIKRFEGCKLEAYEDGGGRWTIGWGTTGPGIVEGLTIKQQTADSMLLGHVREIGLSLTDLIGHKWSQNQFDALTCLIYNIGVGAFRYSSMCRYLKEGQLDEAASEFEKWDHIHGAVSAALLLRRQAEKALFLRP